MHRSILNYNARVHRLLYSTKTFANQAVLRPLPIPELESTGERYKRSLIPLLSKTSHQQACTTIDQFIQGNFGKQLQARLRRLSEQEAKDGHSWLYKLWKDKAYLGARFSNMYSSNWWITLQNTDKQAMVKDVKQGMATTLQLEESARIVAGLLKYCNRINREEIKPEVNSSGIQCMDQLKHICGATRIPDSPIDKYVSQYPVTAKHIMVTYKDQLFSVQVVSGENADHISTMAIKRQLEYLVDQVDATFKTRLELPVGIFTTEDRDSWAKIRKSLETNRDNACNLEDIDTSLFVLCLDHYSHSENSKAIQLNNACGRNGYNRWFDKSVQVIVDTTGTTGFNLEHTLVDGIVAMRMIKDGLKRNLCENSTATSVLLKPPRLLKWTMDDQITTVNALQTAGIKAKKLADDLQIDTLKFNDYGSDLMKRNNISPDGWIQMAIQLAYYRLHGYSCPSYAITSTRRFLTGRSDIIRVCTEESVAFTKVWDDTDIPISAKMDFFKRALATHKENTIAASEGQGIDAHLFGLYHQMTLEEARSEQAAVFQDPVYDYSQSWTICTSNVSFGGISGSYFPPVVPNGYGICFTIHANKVFISLTAFRHSNETDLKAFRRSLEDALADFAVIIPHYRETQDRGLPDNVESFA